MRVGGRSCAVVVVACSMMFFARDADARDAASAQGDTAVARAVEAIVRDRADAGSRGDVARWRRHVADDCAWVGVGLTLGDTAGVAEAQVDVGIRYDIQDFEARVHGDVVVATYVVVPRGGSGDQRRIARLRKLDTYQRRNGEWLLVANAESVEPPPRTIATVDAAQLDRYVGVYAGNFGTPVTVRVWRDGNALMAQDSTSPAPFALQPASDSTFFVEGEPADWTFETGDGGVSALVYRAGGAELRFERVRSASARP